METPTLYTLEKFFQEEICRPGIKLFLYGIKENGTPYEQKIVEINTFRFDLGEVEDESIVSDKKLVAKVFPANHNYINFVQNHFKQMANSGKKLPQELLTDDERFLQLRTAGVKVKRTNADCTTPEELELLQIYRRLDSKKRTALQTQAKQRSVIPL